MSSYSQFNSQDIIPVPSSPDFKGITLRAVDQVTVSQSPFTGQTQVLSWPGADHWEADLTLPVMKRSDAANWVAWLMSLRGQANVFQIGNSLCKTPRGTPSGSPKNDGTHIAGSIYLNTRGWTPSTNNLLLPGDYIQLGYSLYVVAGVTPINSDASGKALIEIWPSLRVALADGNDITTSNCKGLFRLADNVRQYSVDDMKTYQISFKAVEAR
jgi:hypothetical protein